MISRLPSASRLRGKEVIGRPRCSSVLSSSLTPSRTKRDHFLSMREEMPRKPIVLRRNGREPPENDWFPALEVYEPCGLKFLGLHINRAGKTVPCPTAAILRPQRDDASETESKVMACPHPVVVNLGCRRQYRRRVPAEVVRHRLPEKAGCAKWRKPARRKGRQDKDPQLGGRPSQAERREKCPTRISHQRREHRDAEKKLKNSAIIHSSLSVALEALRPSTRCDWLEPPLLRFELSRRFSRWLAVRQRQIG